MSASDLKTGSTRSNREEVTMVLNGPPQEEVARLFMEHKGYGDIQPISVEALDGTPCWYFTYQLPEGTLELEVFWDERRREWDTTVTTFSLSEE